MIPDKMYEVLQWASSFLEENNREPYLASILMQHHLDVSNSQYYTMMQDTIPKEAYEAFIADIKQHVETGVPVQHLTGYTHFYGHCFQVNENVLIPRFETEELVHHLLTKLEKNKTKANMTIVDVGTGSGAIAISLALALPDAKIYATDISKKALEVAKENARNLKAEVTFLEGDFLLPVIEQKICPQVIISNPPYIKASEKDMLADTVKNYDPALALFADNNGLAAYEKILKQSVQLGSIQYMCFEIGYTQAEEVSDLIQQAYPHSLIEKIADIHQQDRIIAAKIK